MSTSLVHHRVQSTRHWIGEHDDTTSGDDLFTVAAKEKICLDSPLLLDLLSDVPILDTDLDYVANLPKLPNETVGARSSSEMDVDLIEFWD